MAFKFESEPQKFYTQWRNGNNFDIALTEYTNRLRGNPGDLVQVRETITVECSINDYLALPFIYDSTSGRLICTGVNFLNEGLFIGATVDIIQGVNSGESEVLNITSRNFSTIFLDTTNLSFLTTDTHTDVVIRVKDAPSYIRLDYGLIRDDIISDSDDLYRSPFDGNPQSYYNDDLITPSVEYLDMIRFGKFTSWDLTRDIQVAFLGTTDDYYHEYEFIHTFRIPPYRDEERQNIITGAPPADKNGTRTLKYASRKMAGYSSTITGSVTNLGVPGDVGYYGDNYNGKRNVYSVDTFTVTNNSGTNRLSVTETNTVTFKLRNSDNRFVNTQKFILSMFRMAGKSEYSFNQTDTFSEIFGFDSVRQTSSAMDPPISSSELQNVDATFVNDEEITVTFEVEFTDYQRSKIKDGDQYAVIIATGETARGTEVEDNATIVATIDTFYIDHDVPNLITNVAIVYGDSNSSFDGDRLYTNQATWNGCFVGFSGLFRLVQYDNGNFNRIVKMESRLVLVRDNEYYILHKKTMPIAPTPPTNGFLSSDFFYQILSGTSNDTDRLPSGEAMNFNQVRSIPPYPADYQVVLVQGSIPRIPWREWVANGEIPADPFFDSSEPNNNLNQRTSNYSGIEGFAVYHEIYLEVENTVLSDPPIGSPARAIVTKTTTQYKLRSDEFEVLDFDIDGNHSAEFTGEIDIYTLDNILVSRLSTTQSRIIQVRINHDQGTLDADDVWGEIWIEPVGATGEVWQLHSEKNYSSPQNQLTGSQFVDLNNTDYVEKLSGPNVFYLVCRTNPENLINSEYNIYYRMGKKTV